MFLISALWYSFVSFVILFIFGTLCNFYDSLCTKGYKVCFTSVILFPFSFLEGIVHQRTYNFGGYRGRVEVYDNLLLTLSDRSHLFNDLEVCLVKCCKRKMSQVATTLKGASIPADIILDKTRQYKEAIASQKSILPSIEAVFGNNVQRMFKYGLSKYKKGEGAIMCLKEYALGTITSNQQTVLSIPLMPEEDLQPMESDERLRKGETFIMKKIHTPVIEVAIDGLASKTSDLAIGVALYDDRHMDVRNAFKGAYVSALSQNTNRCLFFPDHHVSCSEDVNDSLKLVVVCPNSDMRPGSVLAHIRCGALSQRLSSDAESSVTRGMLRQIKKESVHVRKYFDTQTLALEAVPRFERLPSFRMQFASHYEVVQDSETLAFTMRRARPQYIEFSEGRASVDSACIAESSGALRDQVVLSEDLPQVLTRSKTSVRGEKVRRKFGNTSDTESVAIGQCDFAKEDINRAMGQMAIENSTEMSINYTQLQMPQELPEIEMLLHQERTTMHLNASRGRVLVDIPIRELIHGFGNYAKIFETIFKNDCQLLARVVATTSSMSGCALKVGYMEGSPPFDTIIPVQMLAEENSFVWNPAISEQIDFYFSPCSCNSVWNPYVFGLPTDSDIPRLFVIVAEPWVQPPKSPVTVQVKVYLAPGKKNLPTKIDILTAQNLRVSRCLGTIRFQQGENALGKKVDVSLGKPTLFGSQYFYHFNAACLAMFRSYNCDLRFEIIRAASPMVSGNFVCAVLPWHLAQTVDRESVMRYPHAEFSVCGSTSRYNVVFPWEAIGHFLNSDRWEVFTDVHDHPTAVFCIWNVGNVSTTLDGDMVLIVNVHTFGGLKVGTLSAGYSCNILRGTYAPPDGSISSIQAEKGKLEASTSSVATGQMHVATINELKEFFYDMAVWKSDAKTKGKLKLYYLLESTNGEKFFNKESPLYNLFKTATWVKGTFIVKVNWNAKPIRYGARKNSIEISVHETRSGSLCYHRDSIYLPSGSIKFNLYVEGNFNQFHNLKWIVPGEKRSSQLTINFSAAEEIATCNISFAPCDDVQFSGSGWAPLYKLGRDYNEFEDIKLNNSKLF